MDLDLLITGTKILSVGSERTPPMGDVGVADGRIVAVGSVSGKAHRTIDGSRASVVPLVVDTLEQERPAPERYRDKEIAVGNPARFVVARRKVSRREAVGAFIVYPGDLRAVVLDGRVVVEPGSDVAVPALPQTDPRLGTWIDRTGYLYQELDAQGRYDETRAGRKHAWTGRFWVQGDQIVYLDDTSFWAFGEFAGDWLHHAGYVMRRG